MAQNTKKNILKSIFSLGEKKPFISAQIAYSKAKYGKIITLEELLDIRMKDIEEVIEQKSLLGKYSAMVEIDEDLEPYMNVIKDKLIENGFQVICITKKTNIDGVTLDNLFSNFILIFWNDAKPISKNDKNSIKIIEAQEQQKEDSNGK